MNKNKRTDQMKTRSFLTLFVAALLLTACIPSVNPFYTAKDLVFDDRLVGEWQGTGKDDQDLWKFEKAEDASYRLAVTEKEGKKGQFSAHLFKLKEHYFLDIIPTDLNFATNQADLVAFSVFPGHLLVSVPQLEPELKLAFFDFDWLQKQLTNNPSILAHRREDDSFLLTASTRDLQKFVLKHLGPGELFKDPGTMVRCTNAMPASAGH
jgi:hypothetical protein